MQCARETRIIQASLPGDHRALEPPDPIPNSEVKRCIADGSVGYPHVRVGHRQASKKRKPQQGIILLGFSFFGCVDSLSRPDAANGCHVTDPAPQVRGGGAKGVPQGLRALLAT